jgi:hypothetical protein
MQRHPNVTVLMDRGTKGPLASDCVVAGETAVHGIGVQMVAVDDGSWGRPTQVTFLGFHRFPI